MPVNEGAAHTYADVLVPIATVSTKSGSIVAWLDGFLLILQKSDANIDEE
jgi:hypothetical protein